MLPKYDKETLMQMRFIKLEKRLDHIEFNLNNIIRIAGVLKDRIKTLEDARTSQIQINTNVLSTLNVLNQTNKDRIPKPSFVNGASEPVEKEKKSVSHDRIKLATNTFIPKPQEEECTACEIDKSGGMAHPKLHICKDKPQPIKEIDIDHYYLDGKLGLKVFIKDDIVCKLNEHTRAINNIRK